MQSLLDVIKVVDFALDEGKVAVHCHAGLGRTGVLIACYLVYSERMGWEEAIAVVRRGRRVHVCVCVCVCACVCVCMCARVIIVTPGIM